MSEKNHREVLREKATNKGVEIAAIGSLSRTHLPLYHKGHIQIISINPIETGVEVLVRAWDEQGEIIGFGHDGSCGIERFRIFNPPLLVPDGTKRQEIIDGKIIQRDNFKKDTKEALLQVLDHSLLSSRKNQTPGSRNIVRGKTGKTTDVYFATAGGDGDILINTGGNWTTSRSAANGQVVEKTGTALRIRTNFDNVDYAIYRGFLPFDITALPDTDAISAITLSLYGLSLADAGGFLTITLGTQASGSDLVAADYSAITLNSPTEGTARFDITGWNTAGYNDLIGNSNMISWATAKRASGFLDLVQRMSRDVDDSAPGNGVLDDVRFSSSDETGTTQDPKVTIVHAPSFFPPPGLILTKRAVDRASSW